jgi:flagellar M-ring protein FliF
VAVAISQAAMKGAKPQDLKDLEALVSAAVGANPQRGDVVKIVSRSFEPVADVPIPFYEAPWFAMVVRNGAAVLAVLLFLLLGVRPVLKALRADKPKPGKKNKKAKATADDDDDEDEDGDAEALTGPGGEAPALSHRPEIPGAEGVAVEISRADLLTRQIDLAQRLVAEKPGSAIEVVRRMLNEPPPAPPEPEMQPKAA